MRQNEQCFHFADRVIVSSAVSGRRRAESGGRGVGEFRAAVNSRWEARHEAPATATSPVARPVGLVRALARVPSPLFGASLALPAAVLLGLPSVSAPSRCLAVPHAMAPTDQPAPCGRLFRTRASTRPLHRPRPRPRPRPPPAPPTADFPGSRLPLLGTTQPCRGTSRARAWRFTRAPTTPGAANCAYFWR